MTLKQMKKGANGLIESIALPLDLFNRLASMGIIEGSSLMVLDNHQKRPVLVELAGKQFALSQELADKITLAV